MQIASTLAPERSATRGLDEPRIAPTDQASVRRRYRLQLLGGFAATVDDTLVELPVSTWRLVAYLAIAGRPVERAHVANSLWMDKREQRAHANLRSCLWRLRQAVGSLVCCTPTHLCIGDDITVDLRELVTFARRLADRNADIDLDAVDAEHFCSELLPDWYDDFVELEREQIRQLRLHALEALAARLYEAGRADRALDVALTAVAAGPLRESAHRLVITIHLGEGNVAEALRQYDSLSAQLDDQLGVRPSAAAQRLVAPWLAARAKRGPITPPLLGARGPLTVPH